MMVLCYTVSACIYDTEAVVCICVKETLIIHLMWYYCKLQFFYQHVDFISNLKQVLIYNPIYQDALLSGVIH